MHLWGEGSFDNEDAADWLNDFVSGSTLEPIQSAFNEAFDNDNEEYIEDDSANMIIAAGEVVALLRGMPAHSLPEALTDWHHAHQLTVDDNLFEQAVLAVKRVHNTSELRESWEDTSDFVIWRQRVLDLLSRLQVSDLP